MSSDEDYMRMAIEQASYCVSEGGPSRPKVGALLVRDGVVLGKAFRGEIGPGDHAEFTLLEKKLKMDLVAGSTLYTTLEPCTGRGGDKVPCADRIISRKIAHVKIGMLDPNQSICGRGIRLRGAGISTDLFPSEFMARIEEQNRDFTRDQEAISASYPTSRLPLLNPCYESDVKALDKKWDVAAVIGDETLLVVSGDSVLAELLDRVAAAMLRDAVDKAGTPDAFRRAVIVTSGRFRAEPKLQSQPYISVGGPNTNETTKETISLAAAENILPWKRNDYFGVFVFGGRPQVALWGATAESTRHSVENYIESPDGLKKLLPMIWG